jgi:hypothetical protein
MRRSQDDALCCRRKERLLPDDIPHHTGYPRLSSHAIAKKNAQTKPGLFGHSVSARIARCTLLCRVEYPK